MPRPDPHTALSMPSNTASAPRTDRAPELPRDDRLSRRASLQRLGALGVAASAPVLLGACAGPQIDDYARERPALDLRTYFNGTVDAWGVFTDRSGQVVKT